MPDVTPDEPAGAPVTGAADVDVPAPADDPVVTGTTPEGAAGDAPAGSPAPAKRPTIEKALADKKVHVPEGHERGEVMSLGQRAMYRLTWAVSTGIARTYFRASVSGREHVPTTGPFILSPVHRSNLDSPLVALTTRRRMRYMGKESLWKRNWSAWYFTAAGGFPVERATADRNALNACLQVLQRGEPLVLFPEGTRQSGPVVTEMFDGAAWLACRAQCPIIPVGLGGTEAAMGKGTKFPRPAKMTVVIGAPLQPPPPSERGRVSRRAVREMTADLRSRLQELFDEAQERAGTPNRP